LWTFENTMPFLMIDEIFGCAEDLPGRTRMRVVCFRTPESKSAGPSTQPPPLNPHLWLRQMWAPSGAQRNGTRLPLRMIGLRMTAF